MDYPRYEVIAVDDRSEDGTAGILKAAAEKDPRLKYVRIDSLPAGWLGKPHALQKAYEQSSGEWLVFTDADVHLATDLLRRTVRLAERECWEHLTLLSSVEIYTVGEKNHDDVLRDVFRDRSAAVAPRGIRIRKDSRALARFNRYGGARTRRLEHTGGWRWKWWTT